MAWLLGTPMEGHLSPHLLLGSPLPSSPIGVSLISYLATVSDPRLSPNQGSCLLVKLTRFRNEGLDGVRPTQLHIMLLQAKVICFCLPQRKQALQSHTIIHIASRGRHNTSEVLPLKVSLAVSNHAPPNTGKSPSCLTWFSEKSEP